MPFSRSARRTSAFAALLFLTSLLSCGRDLTGPGGGARFYGSVAFAPHFESAEPANGDDAFNVASLVPFTRVRILISKDGAPVLSRVVDFGPTADTVALQVAIPLASSSSDGEEFEASLQYIDAAGDTVFRGGPLSVIVRPGTSSNPTAVEMPLTHVGPGSEATDVNITPDSIVGVMGQTVVFTAEARDSGEDIVPDAVVGFISRTPAVATIANLGSGSVQLVSARGTSWIIAELIDGDLDSAYVRVDPRPTTMILASGNGQFTVQGTAFALPLRVEVRAADVLGVAGWPVTFTVTSGQGTLDSTVAHTDANGFAQVFWTAGDSAGVGSVTASVPGTPAQNILFTGTQQSSAASSLTFESQPTGITAGLALSSISVAVRNGANAVITGYTGPVAISVTGGTAGAQVVGDTNVNAVAGIATFTGLTVNKGGSNYRLVASVSGAPIALSNTFNVAAAPPTTTALILGGGQSAPGSGVLADSIVVRVTDTFGFPVPGVTVNFAVTLGGGSVSPASRITNASGDATTQWTLGASGPQQITATASPVAPLAISATVIGGAGGPTTLFAGYDYTYIAAGQTRTIPLFLSAPSGSATTVQLASSDTTVIAWQSDSVEIGAGLTTIGVPLDGRAVGTAWAIVTSALGVDSVFVTVDSSFIEFIVLESSTVSLGDTARLVVRISEPAPPGGVTLTVQTPDSIYFLVGAGTGRGAPSPGCLAGPLCDGGDLRAVDSEPLIIGSLAGTALIFIPEGAVAGNVVVLPLPTISGTGVTNISAEAPGYVSAETQIYAQEAVLSLGQASVALTEPIGRGQRTTGYVQRSVVSATRDLVATLTSRDEETFTVDSIARIPRGEPYSLPFTLKADIAGAAYLVVEADGFEPDSVLITVTLPELHLEVDAGSTLAVHQSSFMRISVTATSGFFDFPRHSALAVTVRASADSVIELDATATMIPAGDYERAIMFRVVGPGDSYITVEASGHEPDSVFISTGTSGITVFPVSPNAGVGHFATIPIGLSGSLREPGAHTITVTSLNPAIARVLTPSVVMTPSDFNTSIQVEGLAVGSATIRLTGSDLTDTDFNFTVYAPGLTLSGAAGTWVADSVIRSVTAFSFDGGTGARVVMDTVVATLRSTDPSVVQVTDSVVTFPTGTAFSMDGKWRAVNPGTAYLTLHAPGYTSSDSATVIVSPFELVASSNWANVGQGLRTFIGIARTSSTGAALPVTITQTGPGVISLPAGGDTLPPGITMHVIEVAGVTVGVDTLIISAAGHAPDTLEIGVVPAEAVTVVTTDEPMVGFTDQFVEAYLTHSGTSAGFAPETEARFVVTSTDTLKARVEQDTIVIPAGQSPQLPASQFAVVTYHAVGLVKLVVTDVAGVIPPDTVPMFVEPATIFGLAAGGGGALALGMGQQTSNLEVIVGPLLPLTSPLVIYLQSSNPAIVTVPDSVVLAAFQPIVSVTITAGDSVGSARITASSPGWNEFEMDVVVTHGETVISQPTAYVGHTGVATIYVRDAITATAHELAAPLPMRLKSDRPDLASVDSSVFIFPAGLLSHALPGATGVSRGVTLISADDTLPTTAFRKILSAPAQLDIVPSSMYVTVDRQLVGLGLHTENARNVIIYGLNDSAWVRLSSLGGKFTTLVDSVLVVRNAGAVYGETPFDLVGLAAGTDTLVLSADGFDNDTMLVVVRPGALQLVAEMTAPTIVVGDSTLVTLQLQDANGTSAIAYTSLLLNFTIDTTFVVTDGTATIGSLVIDPGSGSVSFWVKALQEATSELTVTSPTFESFRYVFTTRPLP